MMIQKLSVMLGKFNGVSVIGSTTCTGTRYDMVGLEVDDLLKA